MRSQYLIPLLFVGPALVYGQPAKDGPAAKSPAPDLNISRLTVKPAVPPLPSLKYELMPSPLDQTNNNAALMYHRALVLAAEIRGRDTTFAKLQTEVIDSFEKSIKDAPKDKLRSFTFLYSSAFRELEAGAKCKDCDWGTMQRIQDEGIGLLLPEVQQLREIAWAIRARARLNTAEGKYEQALRDIQTGITMGHHVGHGSTFIQYLVGVAITSMFLNELEQVLQLENCPNLYWSLTALPRPLVDIRKAIEGEFRSLEKTIAFPKDLDKGPMSADSATAALEKMFKVLNDVNGEPPFAKNPLLAPGYSRLVLAGYVTLHYPTAKKAMLAAGKTEAELDVMPHAQVVMLDSMIRCRNARDEYFVWVNAPYPEGLEGMRKAVEQFKNLKGNPMAIPQQLLVLLLPAVEKIYAAEIRLARRIASLRTVEAVRYAAAKNNGTFPASLNNLANLTVPVDPLTGKAFGYQVEGGMAIITVPPPPGEQAHRGNSWQYHLTLTK